MDKFDGAREVFGVDAVDTFLALFGLGPKYVHKEPKKYVCPKCTCLIAYFKEIHPDTSMNDVVLYCPDCGVL